MGKVPQIEAAVRRLSASELSQFRNWFHEFDAAAWDHQLEEDAQAGRLDDLADEAIKDLREGRSREL